jgi:hypothetical protein
MNRTNTRRGFALFAMCVCILFARRAQSQDTSSDATIRYELYADSPGEVYLRYLQSMGLVPLYPWSVRGFSPREINHLIPKDTLHPWAARFREHVSRLGPVSYSLIQPSTSFRYNSAFAYGSNDGPIWAGRGLTSAVQLGFQAAWGPVSLKVAPMAFRAENQSFPIRPSGLTGPQAFANASFGDIDLPQRFGNAPYSQLAPGETTLRVDLPFVSAGVSTANQAWGPGQELPVILGNNAAGFPHIFLGTSEPVNVFVAKLHARVFWGELFQSDYSTVTGPQDYYSKAQPGERRFATGLVLTGEPRGIPGLEVGGARFFHFIWPISGIPGSYFTEFLQGFLKKNIAPDRVVDPRFPAGSSEVGISSNELVSVFARWVLPHSGFELHAEYGREDHSYDLRDLTQEPDHSRVYSLGARKVFHLDSTTMTAARLEIMNFQLPQLARYRDEGQIYVHGLIRQGHTFEGQLLGADLGVGTAAGSVLAVDHYTRGGSWTASWRRDVRQEDGDYILAGIRNPRSIDVSHALGFETTRFMRGFDLTGGLSFVRELNRDFLRDETNINALVGVRYLLH